MTFVYRLSKRKYATLDGEGARLYGARWNEAGTPALYAAESLSLAVLEFLVHVDISQFPSDLVWLQIQLPAIVSAEDKTSLGIPSESQSKVIGTRWLARKESLILRVTSAVLPLPKIEANIVINTLHPQFAKVKISDTGPFKLDPRFEQFFPGT
ncbi:MAG: RES family NAD+ phosphorylase [Candidatus Melainabacteria bacterium]|nr:RES family NAD+ phosphorylase [Candidatus Melainabacteria bacterium]